MPNLIFYPGICLPVVSPIEDGLNLVSNIVQSSWQTDARTTTQDAFSWIITQQGVSSFQAASWNAITRIPVSTFSYALGICAPVVHPIDQRAIIPGSTWNVDRRTFSSKATSWKVLITLPSRKSLAWQVLNRVPSSKASSFNTLFRVLKPGVTYETYAPGITLPVVHAIDFAQSLPNPMSTWNLAKRVNLTKPLKFNTFITVKPQQRSLFNTTCIHVSPQLAAQWELKQLVSPKLPSSWALVDRRFADGRFTWLYNARISGSKAASWRLLNKVSPRVASSWALVQRLSPRQASSWMLLDRRYPQSKLAWNVLLHVVDRPWVLLANSPGSIATSVVHPIDVGTPATQPYPAQGLAAPVVLPIDWDFYPGYGYTPAPQAQWRVGINPAGRVMPQQAIAWRTLISVKPQQQITWNLVGRSSTTSRIFFNVLIKVTTTVPVVQWNVGKPLQGGIRQTAIDRTDWAM